MRLISFCYVVPINLLSLKKCDVCILYHSCMEVSQVAVGSLIEICGMNDKIDVCHHLYFTCWHDTPITNVVLFMLPKGEAYI